MPTPMAARTMWVNGPIIVGAGPAGLSVAACLRSRGVPSVVLDRADCIASLWQRRTYDRLRLHLPKRFCELPGMPFPDTYPEYPTKHQFVAYLEAYAARFHVRPRFNQAVVSARFDHAAGLWRVRAAAASASTNNDVAGTITVTEYIGRWLVVATGENAERIVPDFDGAESFSGPVTHVSEYKSGEAYRGKRVLVVGCGNSGMEVCLDLCEHNASPSMVVRDSVHVLPREMLGVATFSVAIFLLRILPLWLVDKILIVLAGVFLGNLGKLGLRRPSKGGPLELKNTKGRTPVLDIGALARIRSGDIKVVPGIRRFRAGGAELVDSRFVAADAVILATGYHSNVPQWLQGSDFFTGEGYPKVAFPEGWKGGSGLYSVGFTRRGLSGVSLDAVRVASDIAMAYNTMSSSSSSFSSSSSCAASSSTAGSSCSTSSSTSCSSSANSSVPLLAAACMPTQTQT